MNQVIKDKLQNIVDGAIRSDRQVRNCLLAVSSGDESSKWAGAAGLADEGKGIDITINTPFYLASITKLFTAVVIMQLYEDGLLRFDDHIVDHLPETLINGIHIYREVDYTDEIQIQHLISHTSGIPGYYDQAPKGGRNFFEILLVEPDREWSVEGTVELARDQLKPNFAPGEKAEYSDTNFQLLGLITKNYWESAPRSLSRNYF